MAEPSLSSKIGTWIWDHGLLAVSSLAGIGLYIGAFVVSMDYVGGKDDWNTIKPKVWTVTGLSIGGALALAFSALLYFYANREGAVIYQIIVSTIALGLSYTAVAIAAISKA